MSHQIQNFNFITQLVREILQFDESRILINWEVFGAITLQESSKIKQFAMKNQEL